ncbi:hypothetical protein ACFU8W_48505 [Streptomyces sp. NPDC057565]|uniref:hypothetical protein n=1 Tax=Streptomyces sp. NPDC057565 TaxID=3346169 RepID=UPI00367A9568
MINGQFQAPQHELNVISSMLRDRSTAYNQFVDWSASEPHYWLKAEHFKSPQLAEIYNALLSGGLRDIEERLRAYPQADPIQVTADAVIARIAAKYQQMAAAGIPGAWETLNNSAAWADMHNTVRQLAQPSWPSEPSQARHDAYVTVRAAQHPSFKEGVPFELNRGRAYDEETLRKELAVIGAIINDPRRAAQFLFQPSSPDASPYWLQPEDFGDPATAEIWDALVTGPDPAITLPAATDPSLTKEQRAQAMIEHIYHRLYYNDYHRSTADPAAQTRLSNNTNQAIAATLAQVSRDDFNPHPDFTWNPDNAHLYAAHFILEPSIPAAVQALAGEVRRDGLADASLYQVSMDLDTHLHALNQLKERLEKAPPTRANHSPADQTDGPTPAPAEEPGYIARDIERKVLISLMQDPHQLRYGGHAGRLGEQDFTQREHSYVFKAVRDLPPDAAREPWVLANRANQLAQSDGGLPLDPGEMRNIAFAARTVQVPPAEQGAGHLVVMTIRRTARDASTAMDAAAQQPAADPRHLVDHSRTQLQQATREAQRHHEQSVPEPTRYATQANVA